MRADTPERIVRNQVAKIRAGEIKPEELSHQDLIKIVDALLNSET